MNRITTNIRTTKNKKLVLELDADRLERLAANFGLFNPDFLASVSRAEADYRAGRTRRIKSLTEIRTA